MHAAEREQAILALLGASGFVSFRELEKTLAASPATIRRDLERLAGEGRVVRVHGGAKLPGDATTAAPAGGLTGVPFHENIDRNRTAKEAIGRAAATLCVPGEGIIIDGGSTTLQMCPHLDGLGLQVLTNSLHIVSALLPQATTRITVPGGAVFREQNIILSAAGDDLMPRFHAPKLFMGAAAVGSQGVMQADIILVAAERRFIERAEQVILLVDSSKFAGSSGQVVCGLDEVDTIVTDDGLADPHRRMLEGAGIKVVIAPR
ncbi:DeoR/GlpR transcriptional regulator [Sphingomonas ginkgonis]|uniref:DeoR/GlpR transcriptional regulator n=1 Tax=Sphingomonas ginkgonis TaxID=2315330 RepID=A0A3R9Z632_9SPHN|nr:DeoR/GlpR family DNA-binding transcription regulator [Sphingomonas ginkgonis]RST30643.1 DeoR/GlpR transcriptional regulator [Sphingomonas ginkgonis]